MDIESSLKKLYSLHTFGIKLGLDNIQNFLDHIGNPQKNLKTFHIAGSNGKGSTAAFIQSILMELNYISGVYTSPHFVRFNERIKINNLEIPDNYIAEFVDEHEKYIDEKKLTFFEVTTAMAFKYFYEKQVDFAVIETGLGGRLDATNVLHPLGVLITSISLEHTNILGNTLAEIAKEKAAIIKDHTKVFAGRLPKEAMAVVENKCFETNSELFKIQDYTTKKDNSLKLYTEELEIEDLDVPLKGDYQKYNAALAALGVSKILDTNDFRRIELGIKNVVKNTNIQGRYEIFRTKPDIIFDSAHNPESLENFLSEFKKNIHKYSKRTLLFAAMKDKDIKKMLELVKNYFDEIFVTDLEIERSCKIDQLKIIAAEAGIKVKEQRQIFEFMQEFNGKNESECLVALGSMYLLGEIKSFFHKKIT